MKKNIGFFTFDFYPFIGGIGVYCHNIYKKLIHRGREDVLFFSPAENKLHNHFQILAGTQKSILKNYGASLLLNLQLKKIIDKYDLGMLHINGGVGSFFLLRDFGIPTIYTVHQTYHQQFTYMPNQGRQRAMYYLEKYGYEYADKIIADCGDTKNNLDKFYGLSSKTTIIPCGLNLEEYPKLNLKKKTKTIIFVGRLAKRKGIKRLVESMQYVLKRDPEIILKIAGSGEMEEELKDIVKKTGVTGNVEFLGFIDENHKKQLISESNALIVPSIFEGFGIIVIEGMALNTLVIGTNTPGIRSLIDDGKNGLLVDYKDTNALVDTILRSLNTNDLQMTTKARIIIEEKYTWDIVTDKILDIYSEFEY